MEIESRAEMAKYTRYAAIHAKYNAVELYGQYREDTHMIRKMQGTTEERRSSVLRCVWFPPTGASGFNQRENRPLGG